MIVKFIKLYLVEATNLFNNFIKYNWSLLLIWLYIYLLLKITKNYNCRWNNYEEESNVIKKIIILSPFSSSKQKGVAYEIYTSKTKWQVSAKR